MVPAFGRAPSIFMLPPRLLATLSHLHIQEMLAKIYVTFFLYTLYAIRRLYALLSCILHALVRNPKMPRWLMRDGAQALLCNSLQSTGAQLTVSLTSLGFCFLEAMSCVVTCWYIELGVRNLQIWRSACRALSFGHTI